MATAAHLRQSEISPDKMASASSLPLSPTESPNDGPLPQGFDELVHHNNASLFPRDHAAIEVASVHSASQTGSRMSTPAPHPAMSPHFNQYGLPPHQQQPEYANDYTYHGQAAYDSPEGAYPDLPNDIPYTTPAPSPSQRSDMLSLRNGTIPRPGPADAMPRPLAPKSRVQKPKKKKSRERADKDKVHLEKPLSEMGEEWKQSMMEIEAYINRSAEERHKEIEMDRKQPGKIKRPMNSFMLYRKAFQNHTKAYCEHNNHQVVSKVCGASWDQEPEAIRKQFGDWAKMERANHQKAHPGYKFTPAKPKNAKRKHNSEDESDLETYDWENGQRLKRGRSHTGTPVPEHDMYAPHQPHQGYYPPPQQYRQHPNEVASRAIMSSYGYTNPNTQMPAPYGAMVMNRSGQYLSSNAMANMSYHQRGYAVEDVAYHKTPSPGSRYQPPMQPSMMDSYGPPQPHGLEHTPPLAAYMHNTHLDNGLYSMNDNTFDPSDPLQLPDRALESAGLDFGFDSSIGHQSLDDGLGHEFGGDNLLHDQQAQQLLRGNDESWDIQPLDEGQAAEQYDEWGVDPSLSQPYTMNDPSLSEVYSTQD